MPIYILADLGEDFEDMNKIQSIYCTIQKNDLKSAKKASIKFVMENCNEYLDYMLDQYKTTNKPIEIALHFEIIDITNGFGSQCHKVQNDCVMFMLLEDSKFKLFYKNEK